MFNIGDKVEIGTPECSWHQTDAQVVKVGKVFNNGLQQVWVRMDKLHGKIKCLHLDTKEAA